MLVKLIRPEFKEYMINEAKTLSLVNDIATLLGEIASGPQHTPALYSAFLKALITAKGAASRLASPRPSRSAALEDALEPSSSAKEAGLIPSSDNEMDSLAVPELSESIQGLGSAPLLDYSLGEMGPIGDPSGVTLTPRNYIEDNSNTLSMDSILTPHFWDSILFPGNRTT